MTFFSFTLPNRRRHECKLHSSAGATLIELVVTCALIVIFMSGVALILPSALKLYNQIRGITYAKQVSGVIINKIRGELETAQNGAVTIMQDANGHSSIIAFQNSNGNDVTITLTDAASPDYKRWFVEKFDAYTITQYGGVGSTAQIGAMDWTFDPKTYMGFWMSSMTFSKEKNDTICVNIKLTSDKYGEYATMEYIKLYNYNNEIAFRGKAVELLKNYRSTLANLEPGKRYTDINSIDGKYVSYRATANEVIGAAKGEAGEHIYMLVDEGNHNNIVCMAYSDGTQYISYSDGKWSAVKNRNED